MSWAPMHSCDSDILFGLNKILNSYMQTVHWAFVNLASIGNVESAPVTSLVL